MSEFLTSIRVWWVDFFLVVTAMLSVSLAAMAVLRQPARRMVVARATLFGLWALLAFSVLPGWPRMPFWPAGASIARRAVSEGQAGPTVGARTDSHVRDPVTVVQEVADAAVLPAMAPSSAPAMELPPHVDTEPAASDSSLFWRAATSLPALYLTGAVVAVLWLLLGAVRTAWLCRRAARASTELRELLSRIVGHRRTPRLLVSDEIAHAVAVGAWRPKIVLGASLAEQFARTAPVLNHEWAHIAHGDLRLLAGCRLLLPLLYFHPLYWLLRAAVRHNQEILADTAVARQMSRRAYAAELLHWARMASEHSPPRLSSSLGFWQHRSSLFKRVRLLLNDSIEMELDCARGWRCGAQLAAMALVVGFSFFTVNRPTPAIAQPPAAPHSAVATSELGGRRTTDLHGDDLPSGALSRLGTVRLRHDSHALAVAFSPDGRTLASSSYFGDIRLWNPHTGGLLRELPNNHVAVHALAFSPQAEIRSASVGIPLLAAGNELGVIRLWNTESGAVVSEIDSRAGTAGSGYHEVYGLSFSPDGTTLASGHGDRSVRLWHVASGKQILYLPTPGSNESNHAIAFSSDGGRLASAPGTNEVRIWNLQIGEDPLIIDVGPRREVVSLAFTPAGGELLVGASRYEERKTPAGIRYATRHNEVLIWDSQTGELIEEIQNGDEETGAGIALSNDGRMLITAAGGRVIVWDYDRRTPLREMGQFQNQYAQRSHNVALTRDGARVALTTGWETRISVWNTQTGALVTEETSAHDHAINAASFLSEDRSVGTVSRDGTVRVWDAATGKHVRRIAAAGTMLRGDSFSPDGRWLVKAHVTSAPTIEDQLSVIQLWDVAAGRKPQQVELSGQDVTATAVSSDGRQFTAAYYDFGQGSPYGPGQKPTVSTIGLWDATSGKSVAQLDKVPGVIHAMEFGSDEHVVNYVTQRGELRAWNTETGAARVLFPEFASMPGYHGSSFDRQLLAASAPNGELRVYDLANQHELLTLAVPNTLSNILAISPDRQFLATAGVQGFSPTKKFDEAIHLWDINTGQRVATVGTPDAAVSAMAFSSDGRLLVTGTNMGTALVWDVSDAYHPLPPRQPLRSNHAK